MEPSRVVRRFSKVSRAQSSADGLQPAAHRLDLLIAEQRALVRNTQESLQQALKRLETSISKEEQESSRMQVQSLLTRAQELVVTVQVILHIRAEISHIQQEIKSAKARHEPTSKLHGRLQWLEQHLEKMLMARRRGRPGAHVGRRVTQAPAGRGGAPRIGRPQQRGMPTHRAEAVTYSIGTMSRGDNISDFDGSSQQDTPWKSESTGTSNYRNAPSPAASSKHSDSDVWHSESEANWTMVEMYSNQPKDITQSQVLGEDEPKQSRLTYTPSWSKSITETSPSPFLQAPGNEKILPCESVSSSGKSDSGLQGYNFEPKRPVEVFGDCSWNSLALATNTNLVQSASRMTGEILGLSMSMLHAGVSAINKDIESLKKLIANAGQAATNPGNLVSANKTAVHFILSSRESASRRSASRLGGNATPTGDRLPSLDDVEECSKINPSRKVYGKQVTHRRSSTYPRRVDVWCNSSSIETGAAGRPPLTSSESIPNGPVLLRLSSRSPVKRLRSRTSRAMLRESEQDDIFERAKHREKCIEHLISQTESPLESVRKSSVQALGLLPRGCEQVEERLQEIMISDKIPLVQYEAFKSLVSLGVVNLEVFAFASSCLKGSSELTRDLLLFLTQDHIIPQLYKQATGGSVSAVEVLQGNLADLLRTDNPHITFPCAILLSQGRLERERCVELLKKALNWSSPDQQSQALTCVIKWWECDESDIISSAVDQMKSFHNWKLRKQAIECLLLLDEEVLLLFMDENGRSIYDILIDRLPDEPILAVRLAIGKLLTHIELDSRAENALLSKLETKNEVIRAEAITALSAFETQSPKNIRVLLECLDLDPSTYVRVQVVRLFANMKNLSPVVLNQFIEKSRGIGPVAKECQTSLQRMYKM